MIESLSDGTKYVVDNGLKKDATLSEKDVFNLLKNREYRFEDGESSYIIGWLKSKNKATNDKNMYNELFKRFPSMFKNINDINDFNSLVKITILKNY